jgi:hypothetical protein
MAGDGAEEVLENGYAPATPPGDNLTVEFVRDMAESWRVYAQRAGDGHRVHVDDELGVALVDNRGPPGLRAARLPRGLPRKRSTSGRATADGRAQPCCGQSCVRV